MKFLFNMASLDMLGVIQLVYTPTAEQAADALTKPATKCSLAVLFQKSGLHLINDEQEC